MATQANCNQVNSPLSDQGRQYDIFKANILASCFVTCCLCQLPYVLYHGTKPDRVLLRRDIRHRHTISEDGTSYSYPVVVTSYEIAMNDREFLMHESWKLMIIDEGHRIKNFNCRLVK